MNQPTIVAQPDRVELLKADLEKLISVKCAEAHCINHDLHKN